VNWASYEMLLPDPRSGLVLRLVRIERTVLGFLSSAPPPSMSPRTPALLRQAPGIGCGDVDCKVVFIRPRSCSVAAAFCCAGVPEPGLMGRRREDSLPWA